MRFLFFTNTPAHVHLYKHATRRLQADGHEVLILGRDYGCTRDLLEQFQLPHVIYGRCGTTKWSLFRRLPGHYARIAREVIRFRPDVIFGIGAYAAHASIVARSRCVLVVDSEPTTIDHRISRPFADVMLTPSSFDKALGTNHYVFNGFKESAYLHPRIFTADPSIRNDLGVDKDERYAVVRFNAFGSHHDIGHSGFPPERRRDLVERLAEHLTVFVSDEGDDLDLDTLPARPFDLHPARIHDALAEAHLLVADTQTMVTEAALLGTPAVRSNSFVGENDMGNFRTLEAAGLIYNVASFDDAVDVATSIAADPSVKEQWTARAADFVADMTDLTDLVVEIGRSGVEMDHVIDAVPHGTVAPL